MGFFVLIRSHRFSIEGRVYPAILPVDKKSVNGRVCIAPLPPHFRCSGRILLLFGRILMFLPERTSLYISSTVFSCSNDMFILAARLGHTQELNL